MITKNIQNKLFFLAVLLLFFVIGLVYYYPRYLVEILGEKSPWLSYLYTYGMGGLFFSFSLLFIFPESKNLIRKNFFVMKPRQVLLLFLYLLVIIFFVQLYKNGLWILLSLFLPTFSVFSISKKKLSLRKRQEWFWVVAVFCGLMFSFSMHGLWILLSVSFPTKF